MSNKVYDVVNKIQRWLPSLGTFYLGLAAAWGLPYADNINKTIILVATLLAGTLEVFCARFYKENTISINKIQKEVEDMAA